MNLQDSYSFPDAVLLSPSANGRRCMLWSPTEVSVVIGKGSNPELELNETAITKDGIPVLRRDTGGCAVVLSPKMLVVSFVLYTDKQLKSRDYFHHFNQIIIQSFRKLGFPGLVEAGTSDLALNDRKVAGTALYRNRELVFYHAILNLDDSTEAMEKYLAFPPRIPDYRKHRSHRDFVSSFTDQGIMVETDRLGTTVEEMFLTYDFTECE